MSELPLIEEEHPRAAEAEYALESPVKCSSCDRQLTSVQVVRLLRTKVNFTSSLPRRGCLVVCPHCQTALPANIG